MKENTAIFRWPLPLTALWLTIPIIILMVRLSLIPTTPNDYWWSLVMGRLIANGQGIPETNLFLYTIPQNTPFHNQPWLGQWLMYRVYEWSSHLGLAMLRTVFAMMSWIGFIALTLRRGADPRVVGAFAMVLIVVGGQVFGVRTQIFALLPYLFLIWGLVEIADGRLTRHILWALLPVTAFWANVHGTFIFAPLFIGAVGFGLMLEEVLEKRPFDIGQAAFWAAALIAFICAGAVNPEGFRIYVYVLLITANSEVSESVTEWQAPSFATPEGAAFLIVLALSMAFAAWRWRRLRPWEILLFAATAYLAVTSMRSIYWWTTIALVVLCPLVLQNQTSDASLEAPLEQTTNMQGIAHTLFLAALVTMALLIQPGTKLQAHLLAEIDADARHHGEGAYVLNHQHPFELIHALATLGYPGRLFHHQCIGGLVEFELTDGKNPRQVAFVDQRMEFIPPSVWEDYFIIENAQADTWQQLIDTYEIGAFLLFGKEQQALIARLESDPRWIPVANDPFFILFLDGEDKETMLRWREAL